ncbi:hypothetical protein F4703DRAFT_1721984, partial [Phycomyces blakesleeanus]
MIPSLWNPATSSICTSQEEMLETTTQFYSDLYSPDDVDQAAIDNLLNVLPTHIHISSSAAESLVAPITYNDLLDAFSQSPQKSSSGMDSLPYELVRLVVTDLACHDIAVEVYNNALSLSDIPPSWLHSCVSLLPKKPPLDSLKNWHPISLINTDAKVFTCIL